MLKRISLFVLCSLLAVSLSAQKTTKRTVQTSVTGPATPAAPVTAGSEAPIPEGINLLMNSYHFDEAEEFIRKEIVKAKKKKLLTDELLSAAEKAKIGANMLEATEKVTFVDSFVVNKADFLKTYKLSPGCGTLATYEQTFPNDKDASQRLRNSTVYINEFKDRIVYSYPNKSGNHKLFSRNKLGDTWSNPNELKELGDTDSYQGYPYILSDGTTLYYAAEGDKSLGGLDIYVTRYNTDTKQYVKPENIGMPFNSPANDYMYAIDETNNLGWFVSDRNQPADKVCIYVFIPTVSRESYELGSNNEDSIRHLARITSIRLSQKNKSQVTEALARLQNTQKSGLETPKEADFHFYVGSGLIYTNSESFKSTKAAQMIPEWQKTTKQREGLLVQLEQNRHAYAQGDKKLEATLLKQEKILQQLDAAVSTLENNIRKEEQAKLGIK